MTPGRAPSGNRAQHLGGVLARGRRFAGFAKPALVNGAAGLVVELQGRPFAVLGFTTAGNRIVELDLILDPAKLERVSLNP